MSKSMKLRIALAVLAAFSLPTAFAGSDQASLTVTATVPNKCKLTFSPATMAFALDPTLTTDGSASSTVTYQCTKNTVVLGSSFTVGGTTTSPYVSGTTQGTGALWSTTNSDYIKYQIAWATPADFTGQGFSSPSGSNYRSVTLNGTVLNADYINKPAGTDYTNTVTISVSY